ncbi:MAG TPA: hypothetical protein VMH47_00855 [Gaiellaceae bacterium]|nr:hypothetical protein [Gaiellaceae bacterium]
MLPRVFTVVFALLGVTAIVVGAHDALVAKGSLGTVLGALFLMSVGVLALVAAAELFGKAARDASSCSARVLVAFGLQSLLGLYVLLSAGASPGSQRPFALAAGAVLLAVGVLGLVVFRGSIDTKAKNLGVATALTIVALLFGFWQFWYQSQYLPAHLGRDVSLNVQLAQVGVQKDYDVIRVTIGYEDLGGDVTVVGSTYTLTGSRVVRCERRPSPAAVRQVLGGYLLDPQRTRYMTDVWEEQPPGLLAAGKFVADGKRLDVNVPAGRTFVFFVPRGRYQLLRFRAQLFAISASVPLLPKLTNVTFPGNSDLYGVWTVADNSWFHDLVNGRTRWIVTRYEDASDPEKNAVSPDFRVTARFPDPSWLTRPPGQAEIEALFRQSLPSASSEPFSDGELALEPIPVATKADARKLPASCRP